MRDYEAALKVELEILMDSTAIHEKNKETNVHFPICGGEKFDHFIRNDTLSRRGFRIRTINSFKEKSARLIVHQYLLICC